MPYVLVLALLLSAVSITSARADIAVDDLTLETSSEKVDEAKVVGGNDRGAAIAVFDDGSIIMGGGKNGGNLYLWKEDETKLKFLGTALSTRERLRDSRFAILDIAILKQAPATASLLVSYPRLTAQRCVEVVVFQFTFDRTNSKVTRGKQWFRSQPCVPVSAVQHAAGRMEVLNSQAAYLTIGDLGFTRIDERTTRGDLGSVFLIDGKKAEKISTGHRNQQGIVLVDKKELLASEHGPRGGDEINLIERGVDYGWPFVTLGAPYSQGDYVIPISTGTHKGYREPLIYWVPSIAPTELVQLPKAGYGRFSNGLAMGTLREQSLVFMEYRSGKVASQEIVDIGARIRDLEVMPNGSLVASTDDGRLIFISPSPSK